MRSYKTRRPASGARQRQKQRLIDACISALHIHGPSRTTVEKVVAIAKMSPGIVRFYFDSKAAMMVASLQFLSTEFEELVLSPVTTLRDTPVAALRRMVDLYLDPEIASSRKVSVWYSFWGEASSRQEYYDICGLKDERFANLVRMLIERLIADTRQTHLEPDGIALGLIGVLEVLWQDIAFQTEVSIDRRAAKHRAMSYLRSIFPGQFTSAGESAAVPAGVHNVVRRPAEASGPFEIDRRMAAHEAQIPTPGDFLTLETASERVLLLRDAAGAVRAWRIARGSG